MGKTGLRRLAAKMAQKYRLAPNCEWVHLVDGPDSPRVVCGKPAVAMLTDPRCGHDVFACPDCLKVAGRQQWWHCPECGTTTSERAGFHLWLPKSIRKANL